MRGLLFTILIICLVSCLQETKQDIPISSKSSKLQLKYAQNFSVDILDDYKILSIKNPWPNAEKTYKYLLASKAQISKMTFPSDYYDGIITNSISKIVVTSTTHIPALELLGIENTLVGFPGTDYISSLKTRNRIDNGLVKELGKNEGVNTEVLLDVNPDLVIGFGVDGINKTFETIRKANIPVIYNADWMEVSALAKAEWIKFFGVLFNKEKVADSVFNLIEKNYLEAKELAKTVKTRPTVLSGAMTNDIWHLPAGNSPEAQFLKDANVNYLWKNTKGNGSLHLSFEAVLEKGKDADLWLSPSYYKTLEQLQEANPLYTNFKAFKNKSVYSFTNAIGPTGGTLYYEIGTTRPDLILKDIIKIAHPELLKDYQPYLFAPLE